MELLARRNPPFIANATAGHQRPLSYLFDIILHQITVRELVGRQRAGDLNAGGPLEAISILVMGPHRCVAHQAGTATHIACCSGVTPGKTMETETMLAKTLPAIVVGLLLGTTALASAQTRDFRQAPYDYRQQRMMQQYPGAYWQDPYAGTPFENVAPYGADEQPDPYAGTVWDGVAPY
jgi:hypothetical protein